MVIDGVAARCARRFQQLVQHDLHAFRAVLVQHRGPRLRTFDLRQGDSRRRLHLRVHSDGSAVLMVDVTEAIHLNPAAALLVEAALDGVPEKQAIVRLQRRFRLPSRAEAEQAVTKMYTLVARLNDTSSACPTCGLLEADRSAWFTLPVAAPYKADLALTYGCNNACSHCYNRRLEEASPRSALLERQWRLVLRRLGRIGVPHVVFTGGEPTLCEFLPALIAQAARLGLVAGLNTNGRRLADRGFAGALRIAGLDHVQITLESHRPEVHNAMTRAASFDETVAGLKNALRVGLHTLTNTTLTRRNIGHVGELMDFLHQQGLRTFAMNGMIYSGNGCTTEDALPVESLAPVLSDIRDRAARLGMRFLWYTPTEYCRLSPLELDLGPRRCNAAEYSICIEPNGDVLPCQSYYVSAGNILRDSWPEIWESQLFRSIRHRLDEPAGLPPRCVQCPDRSLCAGGCPLEREHLLRQRGGRVPLSLEDGRISSCDDPAGATAYDRVEVSGTGPLRPSRFPGGAS